MSEKVYSGINDIPSGDAPDTILEGCLVLEGGAFRGVYTNGVIDVLMQNGINMRTTYGVSAGAMNGLNYAAGQIGRSARVNLRYRSDSRYVGRKAIKNNQGIIGFDFVFGRMDKVEPLNVPRLMSPDREFFAVATCLETGKPVVFGTHDDVDIYQAVRASASMPFVSKAVTIGRRHYLDGGCSCKIPYRFALERGFEKIIVVRTRPRSYRKPMRMKRMLTSEQVIYRSCPEFARVLGRSNMDYDIQCDELEALEAQGRIFVIAPSKPLNISRLEGDVEKLGELYHLGYDDTLERLDDLKAYLGI